MTCSMTHNWSEVGAKGEDKLEVSLVLSSLPERSQIRQYDQVEGKDATTPDPLYRPPREHASYVVAGTADGGPDREEYDHQEVDGSPAKDIR